MAKRIFSGLGVTFTQLALGTIFSVANSYMAYVGTSTTQVTDIDEILISGTASSSTIGGFVFVPFSTAATGPSALANPFSDGPMVSGATPTTGQTFTTVATTQPTSSSAATCPRINLGLNTFGGIIRWNAAPTQQWTFVGSAAFAVGPPATFGTGCLMNTTTGNGVTTTANAHIIYEPY